MAHEADRPGLTRQTLAISFSRPRPRYHPERILSLSASSGFPLDVMPREEPGDYDIYLLAQTWSPMFCCKKADR